MNTYKYLLFDGDKVRNRVELYLLEHELKKLSDFSLAIYNAIDLLKKISKEKLNAKIIYGAGDELFIYIDENNYNVNQIKDMINCFRNKTNCTMSVGVGNSPDQAFINLRKAKSAKSSIVDK